MIEVIELEPILASDHVAAAFQRLDENTCQGHLDAIRRGFTGGVDAFRGYQAISAEIGLAVGEPRQVLQLLRSELEARMLQARVNEVRKAIGRSRDEVRRTWLVQLADALRPGFFNHAFNFCTQTQTFLGDHEQSLSRFRRLADHLRQGRWEEACESLELLSNHDFLPATLRARSLALVAQIVLWRFDKPALARQHLEDARRMAPSESAPMLAAADYWATQKEITRATEFYERVIAASPQEASGYVGIGDLRWNEDKFEEAESWYRRAVSAASGDSQSYSKVMRSLGRAPTLKQHEAEFLSMLEARIAVDEDDRFDTYLDASRYYAENKNADENALSEAREWCRKAIALQPRWSRAYTALANVSRAEGKLDDTESYLKRAIEVGPDCPDGYFDLARLYEDGSRWSDALEVYAKFPELPQQWKRFARAAVGRMHWKLGQVSQAEELLVAQLQPDQEEAYAQRELESIAVAAYRNDGDTDATKRVLAKVLAALGEQYAGAYHNLLGIMHHERHEYEAAAVEYRLAIAAVPDRSVYHRNLSQALRLLGDFEDAEIELENAYSIDKDEKRLQEDRATLANARGNNAYEKEAYSAAVEHYGVAAKLDPADPVYHANLALAWLGRRKEEGGWERALDEAIQSYERAQAVAGARDYTKRLAALRNRKVLGRSYDAKALDLINLVTPVAIEVAGDLAVYVERGPDNEGLAAELSNALSSMREELTRELGVKVPGVRFRTNETDLPNGTYIVMINEIPVVAGNLAQDRRFCESSVEALTLLDIKGEPATHPISGAPGAWVEREQWKKVEAARLELWGIPQYMVKHLEAVLRQNLGEFFGHQEVADRLDDDGVDVADIRASSRATTALTMVCRALLAEGVTVQPIHQICACFDEPQRCGVGLRELVERIRSLPEIRDRLPGNQGSRVFKALSRQFEDRLRQSLYERGGHLILAMEPEQCQEALTAIRHSLDDTPTTLLVTDAALRPFVRKLVELEFPHLPVLSRAELRKELEGQVATEIDMDPGPAPRFERKEGRVSRSWPPPTEKAETAQVEQPDPVVTVVGIEVFAPEGFAQTSSAADGAPMDEMFSLMRDGLFYENGVVLPNVRFQSAPTLDPHQFAFKLSGKDYPRIDGLNPDEFLVNDTVDRLTLLNIRGREAINPANGAECAIVREQGNEHETCTQAGLTTWGPRGYLVLNLSAKVREAAREYQTEALTRHCLDRLAEAFPQLVQMALERYPLASINALLGELLVEEVSIRDLRSILESMLAVDGTTDVDLNRFIVFWANTDGLCPAVASGGGDTLTMTELADFVRMSLKRYLSHKYTRGGNTLVVYLMDPKVERRVAECDARPLSDEEHQRLLTAINDEVGSLPPTASQPVLLTTFDVRRRLRRLICDAFPRLAVVSYQELSPDMNIQPIARIAW